MSAFDPKRTLVGFCDLAGICGKEVVSVTYFLRKNRKSPPSWPAEETGQEMDYEAVHKYWARPLKRVIQRALQNPLAGLILAGKIADG